MTEARDRVQLAVLAARDAAEEARTVNIEEVRRQSTTPLGAPAYPAGRYRFTGREYLNILVPDRRRGHATRSSPSH